MAKVLLFLLSLIVAPAALAGPNIIVFVAEDLGVDKVGVYAEGTAPPATPVFNLIATSGVIFRNAWSNAEGDASKASLLTGRYAYRTGVGANISDPNTTRGIDALQSIGWLLKAEGYDTAAFGRWNVGGCAESGGACTGPPVNPEYHPVESGFNTFIGSLTGVTDYCNWVKTESTRLGPSTITSSSQIVSDYATEVLADDAGSYLATMQEPFFALVSFDAANAPLHDPPANPVGCTAAPAGTDVDMYDAMVETIDAALGSILTSIPQPVLDNTIVIIMGGEGTPGVAIRAPFDPAHGSVSPYEAGINVPLLIAASSGVTPGESSALVHSLDVAATVMELVNPLLDVSDTLPDSVSLVPFLTTPGGPPVRSFVYSERFAANGTLYEDQSIRDSQYKLIRRAQGSYTVSAEFYDLLADPHEQNDLLAVGATLTGPEAAARDALHLALSEVSTACFVPDDLDMDCVEAQYDNCTIAANGPSAGPGYQCDTDQDGYGNHCDNDFDNNPSSSNWGRFNSAHPSTLGDTKYDPDIDMDCDGDIDDDDLALFAPLENGIVPSQSGLACAGSVPCEAASRDNFMLIILDDVGVDNIGAYRDGECVDGQCPAPPPTPNLDSLASDGLLFRNAWSNPICSPTRATLLTGRYSLRTGVGRWLPNPFDPVLDQPGLEPSEVTLPAVLSANGYETAAFGKWHLAGCETDQNYECIGPPNFEGHPIQAGFDYFSGSASNFGSDGDYCSWEKIEAQRTGPGPNDYTATTFTHDVYATVDTVDSALYRLKQMHEPWFAWVSFNASHIPIHSPPSDPYNCSTANSPGSNKIQYRAMTEAVDTEVGRLFASMQANSDVLARTTIIALGDNGTIVEVTEPPFLALHAKGTVYEGGVNVPFIVSGPRVSVAPGGEESDALINSTDVFDTVMDVLALDPCVGGTTCAEDSVSFYGHMQNPALSSTRSLVFAERFWPNTLGYPDTSEQAVRDDTYKLLRHFDGSSVSLELYDLISDPWELTDLLDGSLSAPELAAFGALGAEMNRLIGVCIDLADSDTDCVDDVSDNCIDFPNGPLEAGVAGVGNQTDVDSDLIGDPCDLDNGLDPDDDGDGILDIYETNTGTYVSPTNTGTHMLQRDSDGDMVGDGNEVEAGSDPTNANSVPSYFTEKHAFLHNTALAMGVLDFDLETAGSLLSGVTFTVASSVDIGIGIPGAVLDVLDPNGPTLDLIAVAESNDNPTTSSNISLGADDSGNYNTILSGTLLDFTFDTDVHAFAVSIVTPDQPDVALFDSDLELEVVGVPGARLRLRDKEFLGNFDGVAYYTYFLATTSASPFTAASLKTGPSVPNAAFLFNVDDVIAVPEPHHLALLAWGCIGLLALRRRR